MISKNIAKKILTVGEDYNIPRGGISSVINTYSRHFSEFKFVSTYNPQQGKWGNILHFFKRVFRLCTKLITDKEIQIVHIHGTQKGSFYRKLIILLITKNIFSKKIIFHCHASYFHEFYKNSNYISKKLIHYFINRADLIICLSPRWKVFFEENFVPKSVMILENIVERVHVSRDEQHSNIIKLLFLGEIGERKGIFDLLQVLKENRKIFENKLHLAIGGNGEVKKLLEFIDNYNLHSMVSYEGWVAGEKKHALLLNCHLYILPSYNEGLPISILEALSYNLPVISSDVGGISEIIKHEINGYLITPGDRETLFRYLKKFVDNPLLLEKMGNQSKSFISSYYSDSVIPKLELLYKNILNRN